MTCKYLIFADDSKFNVSILCAKKEDDVKKLQANLDPLIRRCQASKLLLNNEHSMQFFLSYVIETG